MKKATAYVNKAVVLVREGGQYKEALKVLDGALDALRIEEDIILDGIRPVYKIYIERKDKLDMQRLNRHLDETVLKPTIRERKIR